MVKKTRLIECSGCFELMTREKMIAHACEGCCDPDFDEENGYSHTLDCTRGL